LLRGLAHAGVASFCDLNANICLHHSDGADH
jgi:hypothetical protein